MSSFDSIKAAWASEMSRFANHPWMKKLDNGELTLSHYKGFLLETYHNAGMNPQLQAYATLFFKDNPRPVIKKFYQHAISEIGHDLMAKSDLMALGVPESVIVNSKPSPENLAFFGYFLYQIQFKTPLAYLGYLFHLEFTPTTNGRRYIEMFEKKGIPPEALTFLEEHATVDISHNKMMMGYIEELLKTKEQVEIVADAARAAVRLHLHMLFTAFENGEALFPDKKTKAG